MSLTIQQKASEIATVPVAPASKARFMQKIFSNETANMAMGLAGGLLAGSWLDTSAGVLAGRYVMGVLAGLVVYLGTQHVRSSQRAQDLEIEVRQLNFAAIDANAQLAVLKKPEGSGELQEELGQVQKRMIYAASKISHLESQVSELMAANVSLSDSILKLETQDAKAKECIQRLVSHGMPEQNKQIELLRKFNITLHEVNEGLLSELGQAMQQIGVLEKELVELKSDEEPSDVSESEEVNSELNEVAIALQDESEDSLIDLLAQGPENPEIENK